MGGNRNVAEVVVGHLLQGLDLVEYAQQALKVGVEGVGLGVHCRAPWLMDDASIHALGDQEAKLV